MLLAACVAIALLFGSGLAGSPQVVLNDTAIVGSPIVYDGYAQEFFGGVPFASSERFGLPQLASLTTSTLNATSYGALCAQPFPTDFEFSEDCLTVNILRPALNNTKEAVALPVMVWIYGGTFLMSQLYNGSALVANSVARGTPIIHVSLNYRLGPFGFPQGEEAIQRGALNLGLKDQFLALQWIQYNIAAFGGDPAQVTVFGQSAGAISIAMHYLNPQFESVAHAAIMQSGSAASVPLYNATLRTPAWQTFVNATPECAGADMSNTFPCLQSANTSTLLSAWLVAEATTPGVPFAPVLDGEGGVLPELPSKLFSQGRFARVPFIAGTVLDEGTGGVPTTLDYSNETLALELVTAIAQPYAIPDESYTETMQHAISLYPINPALGSPFDTGNETFGFNPQFKRYAAFAGDFVFQALRRNWMQTATSFGVPTFGYIFTDQDSVDPTQPWLGVHHATDIDYVYGMDIIAEAEGLGRNTSLAMMDYWTSFATSLTPNDGKGLSVPRLNWPQYKLTSPKIIRLGENLGIIPDNYRTQALDYLNSVPEILGH